MTDNKMEVGQTYHDVEGQPVEPIRLLNSGRMICVCLKSHTEEIALSYRVDGTCPGYRYRTIRWPEHFRVDRPGRYRMRRDAIALVHSVVLGRGHSYPALGFSDDLGPMAWATSGRWNENDRIDNPETGNDLVEYLGPLDEDEES